MTKISKIEPNTIYPKALTFGRDHLKPKTTKDIRLAELILKNKMFDLALRLFTRLSEDTIFKKNIYLYSGILFDLGVCYFACERYDLAYVQFMNANTVWPTSTWAPFAASNAAVCIEAFGGTKLALKQFHKNTKTCENTDNLLSMAYGFYQLNALIKSNHYLNLAFELDHKNTIVLRAIVSLYQEMSRRGIEEQDKNHNALFTLARYFRDEKQPHKALVLYRNWFASEKKGMLCLLELIAECYDEMEQPQLAIQMLQKMNKLFTHAPGIKDLERIKQKQVAADAVITDEIRATLKPMDEKAHRTSREVCDNIQASLIKWKSHPNISYLRFFATPLTTETISISQGNPIHPSKSCVF